MMSDNHGPPQDLLGGASNKDLGRCWRTRPYLDLVSALVITLITLCVDLLTVSKDWIVVPVDSATRRTMYQTVAGLSGTLLGLSVTTVGLILANFDKAIPGLPGGLPTDTLSTFRRGIFSLIRALGYLCLTSLALIPLDTGTRYEAPAVRWLFVLLLALVVLRLVRAIYALHLVVLGRAGG